MGVRGEVKGHGSWPRAEVSNVAVETFGSSPTE